ncbi:MAG: trypsin-like peptidase domain-containing protein [Pirellulales bacterium]|nr:trypsin-like peptidase domain-containing protein [Pirellulales bacterium]
MNISKCYNTKPASDGSEGCRAEERPHRAPFGCCGKVKGWLLLSPSGSLRGRVVAATIVWLLVTISFAQAQSGTPTPSPSLVEVARQVQPKIVKLYGTGGVRGLEAYQSGVLISGKGHVLTVWSYVLDADEVTVVLDDGRHFMARLVASDPLLEVAVLKFDVEHEDLPHFELSASGKAIPGERVLAFSNLFGIAVGDEPVSMLHGVVSAIAPLEARRGAFASNYRGNVYVVDAAANNPGAGGGALTDSQGRLLGMLGKELRSNVSGTWLNYALPVDAFESTVQDMLAGRFTPADLTDADRPEHPLSLAALGIVLVPDVLSRTPPYIDRVLPNSAAEAAGLRQDDLLLLIETQVANSCREAHRLVERLDQDATCRVAVLREDQFLEFTLSAASAKMPSRPNTEPPIVPAVDSAPVNGPPPQAGEK